MAPGKERAANHIMMPLAAITTSSPPISAPGIQRALTARIVFVLMLLLPAGRSPDARFLDGGLAGREVANDEADMLHAFRDGAAAVEDEQPDRADGIGFDGEGDRLRRLQPGFGDRESRILV